jgi:hypothetical protein
VKNRSDPGSNGRVKRLKGRSWQLSRRKCHGHSDNAAIHLQEF